MNENQLLRAALASLPPTGWNMPGQYDPGRVLPVRGNASLPPTGWNMPSQYDPGMASTLATLRQQVESQGGGGAANPYVGMVFGDTPGAAQSALLNLRAQNIQIEQEAARRAEQARQADLDRQLRARLESDANRIRSTQLADQLLSSASARDIAAQEAELKRILGIGKIELDRAGLGLKSQPGNNSEIMKLLGFRPQLDEAAQVNEDALAALQAQIESNAQAAARKNNLLVSFGADGTPEFSFVNPNLATTPQPLYAAEDATYAPGGVDLRPGLNRLLGEQSRLEAGRKTYLSDLATALRIRNDKQATQVPESTDRALSDILTALRALGPAHAPAETVGTRAQQLLAARGNVIGASTRRPPAPKAAKGWRLDANGNVTRN